jgi:hypothetical protein
MSLKLASVLTVAGLCLSLGTGCANTVHFNITRAAMINLAPAGNTVSVGAIAPKGNPEAAADVTADIQYRVSHSLNPSIRLLASGGGVIVDGSVDADGYAEHTETVSATCSRTVDDGVDANGTPQSHSESYDCSYDVTVGVATSQLSLRIVSGSGGRVILAQTYTQSDSATNPNAAGVAQLRHNVRDAAVGDFARTILPYDEVVTERFKDCDGDSRCKRGFHLVSSGDLEGAEALFSQVIGGFDTGSVVPGKRTKEIGEAFYDRGVTRVYLGRYAEAVADMEKAIQLQPQRKKWPQEVVSFKIMARDRQALHDQGAL